MGGAKTGRSEKGEETVLGNAEQLARKMRMMKEERRSLLLRGEKLVSHKQIAHIIANIQLDAPVIISVQEHLVEISANKFQIQVV